MSRRHFLGIGKDAGGHIVPLFAPPDIVLDAMTHHRSVVEALRKGPFVPAAFGSPFGRDPVLLAQRIRTHREGLRNALGESREIVEMGVMIGFADNIEAPVTRAVTGRAFLRQAAVRAGSVGETAHRIDQLVRHIAAMDGVSRCQVLTDAMSHKSIALAVKRANAPTVASAIEARSLPGLTLEITGPWPLYSFGLREIFGAEAAA